MCQVLEMNGFDWCDQKPTRPDEPTRPRPTGRPTDRPEPTRPTGRPDPEECDRETTAECNDIVMRALARCRASGTDDLVGCMRRMLADTDCGFCMCQVLEMNGFDWCDQKPTRPDEPTRPRPTGRPTDRPEPTRPTGRPDPE